MSKEEFNGDMPMYLKTLLAIINRVGFPIVAFLLMFWVAYTGLEKLSSAIGTLSNTQFQVASSLGEFRTQVTGDHKIMCEDLNDIKRVLPK